MGKVELDIESDDGLHATATLTFEQTHALRVHLKGVLNQLKEQGVV
jgi:hypothetical protein